MTDPINDLIHDAEAYLTAPIGEGSLFGIEWADGTVDALRDTTYGHRVSRALREWLADDTPRLDDALIRRGLKALRVKRGATKGAT